MENTLYELARDRSDKLYVNYDKYGQCAPHFHRNFELLYICGGSVRADINRVPCDAGADQMLFIQHFHSHELIELEPSSKLVIIPPPDYCKDFEALLAARPLPRVLGDEEYNRTLKPYFEQLIEIEQSEYQTPARDVLARGLIDVIFGRLLSHYEPESPAGGKSSRLIYDFLFYIDQNYKKNLSLDTLSGVFGYNKHYFSKLWNSHIGMSLNAYVNTLRTQKAAEKIRDGGFANISDIVYDCGFDSLTTFYRYYNALYGERPKNRQTLSRKTEE